LLYRLVGGKISGSEDSDDGSEEEEEDEEEEDEEEPSGEATMDVEPVPPRSSAGKASSPPIPSQFDAQLDSELLLNLTRPVLMTRPQKYHQVLWCLANALSLRLNFVKRH
jgi:hypothetical protein